MLNMTQSDAEASWHPDEPRSAGDHVLSWEGTSDRGGRVASGVYFLRVSAPQGEEMQRVTVLK